MVSLVFFILVSISFCLLPRLVVSMDNISKGSRNVAFENKVLSWYKLESQQRTQVSILELQFD
jgi:hypothetical protein